MGKSKKQFIDKRKSVTYNLVFRDSDPSAAGPLDAERTLAPTGNKGPGGGSEDPDDVYIDGEESLYESEYSLQAPRCVWMTAVLWNAGMQRFWALCQLLGQALVMHTLS